MSIKGHKDLIYSTLARPNPIASQISLKKRSAQSEI